MVAKEHLASVQSSSHIDLDAQRILHDVLPLRRISQILWRSCGIPGHRVLHITWRAEGPRIEIYLPPPEQSLTDKQMQGLYRILATCQYVFLEQVEHNKFHPRYSQEKLVFERNFAQEFDALQQELKTSQT